MFSKVLTTVVVACAVVTNVSWAGEKFNYDCVKKDPCVEHYEYYSLNHKKLNKSDLNKFFSFKENSLKYDDKVDDGLKEFEQRKLTNNTNERFEEGNSLSRMDFIYSPINKYLCDKTYSYYVEQYRFYKTNTSLYLHYMSVNRITPISKKTIEFRSSNDTPYFKIELKEGDNVLNFGFYSTFIIRKEKNGDIKIKLLSADSEIANNINVKRLDIDIQAGSIDMQGGLPDYENFEELFEIEY